MSVFSIIEEHDGTFMIAPQAAHENSKYLIQTTTRSDAENIQYRLGSGELATPLANEESYEFVKKSVDTPIFKLR